MSAASSAVLKGIDDLKVKGFRPDQMQVAPAGGFLVLACLAPVLGQVLIARALCATICCAALDADSFCFCCAACQAMPQHCCLPASCLLCLLQPCRHTILPTCLTGLPHAQDKVLELYERHMSAPNREERQRKDVISHFVLRLAYCRTGVCWPRAAGGRCRCCIPSRDHGLHCRWLPTHRHQLSSSPCMSRCRGPTPLADRPGVRPVPRPLQGDGALRPGGWASARTPNGSHYLAQALQQVHASPAWDTCQILASPSNAPSHPLQRAFMEANELPFRPLRYSAGPWACWLRATVAACCCPRSLVGLRSGIWHTWAHIGTFLTRFHDIRSAA